jgi:hypothetical protein
MGAFHEMRVAIGTVAAKAIALPKLMKVMVTPFKSGSFLLLNHCVAIAVDSGTVIAVPTAKNTLVSSKGA